MWFFLSIPVIIILFVVLSIYEHLKECKEFELNKKLWEQQFEEEKQKPKYRLVVQLMPKAEWNNGGLIKKLEPIEPKLCYIYGNYFIQTSAERALNYANSILKGESVLSVGKTVYPLHVIRNIDIEVVQ